jgi:E3 ubiquitin-protein ligase SHPRH
MAMTQQSKALVEMEKEQELFRGTMNQRLEYYRQFQHISDTVAAYKEELDDKFDHATFQIFDYRRKRSLERVNTLKAKHNYLTNLRVEDQKSEGTDCIICQETIEIGVLTTCGHKVSTCLHRLVTTNDGTSTAKSASTNGGMHIGLVPFASKT